MSRQAHGARAPSRLVAAVPRSGVGARVARTAHAPGARQAIVTRGPDTVVCEALRMSRTRPPVRSIELLVSCEHGGNRIPARYRKLFSATRRVLATHRAYDPGALTMARDFARAFGCDLHYSTVSRLLVE